MAYCRSCDEPRPFGALGGCCEVCGAAVEASGARAAERAAGERARLVEAAMERAAADVRNFRPEEVGGGGAVAISPELARLMAATAAVAAGGGLPAPPGGNPLTSPDDVWETPPPEAFDPTAAAAPARATSAACLKRIPRVTVSPRSSILFECVLSLAGQTALDCIVAEFGPPPPYSLPELPLSPAEPGKLHVVRRGGGETFARKALRAQEAGARGVVVVQDQPVWPYVMMDSSGEAEKGGLTIPVVMVKRSDGDRLLSLLSSGAPLSGSVRAKRSPGDDDCVICRDTFAPGDAVLRMPSCVHTFHEACALQWLRSHNTCPTCRRELPTDDEGYEEERRRAGRSHAGGGRQATGWEEMLFG